MAPVPVVLVHLFSLSLWEVVCAHVVFGAIQFQSNAAHLADRSAQVIIKSHLIFRRNEWPAIFRGEDYVIKEIRVGVGHALRLARMSRNISCKEVVGRSAGRLSVDLT